MPYLMSTHMGDTARELAQTAPPFGPGASQETVEKCEKVELHASSFSDPGGDWCEFRLFDKDGQMLERSRVGGY